MNPSPRTLLVEWLNSRCPKRLTGKQSTHERNNNLLQQNLPRQSRIVRDMIANACITYGASLNLRDKIELKTVFIVNLYLYLNCKYFLFVEIILSVEYLLEFVFKQNICLPQEIFPLRLILYIV